MVGTGGRGRSGSRDGIVLHIYTFRITDKTSHFQDHV